MNRHMPVFWPKVGITVTGNREIVRDELPRLRQTRCVTSLSERAGARLLSIAARLVRRKGVVCQFFAQCGFSRLCGLFSSFFPLPRLMTSVPGVFLFLRGVDGGKWGELSVFSVPLKRRAQWRGVLIMSWRKAAQSARSETSAIVQLWSCTNFDISLRVSKLGRGSLMVINCGHPHLCSGSTPLY